MGDRHGGRFARRGRALSPSRPQVDAHRGVNFRWRATVFRCRGVVGRICPRRNTPLGESLPTRRTSERICPRAETRPSAKASRHGARAKGFAPRRNTPLGEGLPTRRTSERICPAQEHAPRRKHPDTAHERKDLPRAGTRPTAKASRHGARAKGFAPRRNTLLGEGIPTRRTSKRICSAGVRVRPTCRRTAGRPRPMPRKKNTPSAGSHPQRAAAAEFIHRKK